MYGVVTPPSAASTATTTSPAAPSTEQEQEILKVLKRNWGSTNEEASYFLKKLHAFRACREIEYIEGSAKFITDNGGINEIYMLITEYKRDSSIVSDGIRILGSLIKDVPGALDEAQSGVDVANLAMTVIEAMTNHPDLDDLQSRGCYFFRFFTKENADHLMLVRDLGGIPTVVKGMKNHPNDLETQEWAIAALHDFCLNPMYVELVFQASGFNAMAMALANHEFGAYTKALAKDAMNALNEYMQSDIQGVE